MDFSNKLILAPMVRIGTLPMRLLALRYGADLVYSEEIIDHKMLQCKRVENDILGSVDYVLEDGSVVFRTCEEERGKIIFQIGTNNAERALKVARMMERDVSGVDINMGCPKEFSIKGGMGAALLTQPDKIKEILTTLVRNLSIPVTCKIRILPQLEDTLRLVKVIEECGVAALAVHGRTRVERPRDENHDDVIREISAMCGLTVIANGGSREMTSHDDITKLGERTGCGSVMLARAAQWNPSIFSPQGLVNRHTVIKEYIKICCAYDHHYQNAKYVIQQLLHDELHRCEEGRLLMKSTSLEEICYIWCLGDYLASILSKRKCGSVRCDVTRVECDGKALVEMDLLFIRKSYPDRTSPKSILLEYSKKRGWDQPQYKTDCSPDGRYRATLSLNNSFFRSTLWEKKKKFAEQAAAVIFLRYYGLDDGRVKKVSVRQPN